MCETLKCDESNLFVQGLENLQKELLGTPLRKMKPSSLHIGVNQLHVHSNPDKEVGHARLQSSLINLHFYSAHQIRAFWKGTPLHLKATSENLLFRLLPQLKMEVRNASTKKEGRN